MTEELTFGELRLANMLHRDQPFVVPGQQYEFVKQPDLAQLLMTRGPDLAQTLADMVIIADRVAAITDIDLVAAIRARFEPTQKVLHDVTPPGFARS